MALAQANGHGDATSAAAVVMNPRTGGIYALASYPTYNQVAAANNPAYRNALYRSTSANPPLLEPRDAGPLPHRLDLQADRRGSRRSRRD